MQYSNSQIDELINPDLSRLKSTILYIFQSFTGSLNKLGIVKLNKILWFSDSENLATNRTTITGQDVYRVEYKGPVLPPLDQALNELDPNGNVLHSKKITKDRIMRILNANNGESHTSELSQEKTKILDYWINLVRNKNSKQVSDLSHSYDWWQYTFRGQHILVHLGARDLKDIKPE